MARYCRDRKGRIGSGDVAAILGLSKWRTPLHVYHAIRGTLPDDAPISEAMEFGILFEKPCAERYAKLTGRTIRRPPKTFRHPERPYLTANPDYLQTDPKAPERGEGTLEVKWLDASRYKQWVNDGVPEAYYLQKQHQLLCTGLSWGSYTVMFGGNRQEHFDVPRDEAIMARWLELADAFWQKVQTGTPPDLTWDALGLDILKRLYPQQVPAKEILLDSDEAVAKATRYFALDELVAAREAERLGLEVWLKAQMADAELALVPGIGKFTWKAQTAERLDIKRLRAERPEIADAYKQTTNSRVFRKTQIVPEETVAAMVDEMSDLIALAPTGAGRRILIDE